MEYEVNLTNKAERFLKKLDKQEQLRIRDKLRELKTNPKVGEPLTADLSGQWSLRIGKYRAVYLIEDNKLIVLVLDIGHGKKIYR